MPMNGENDPIRCTYGLSVNDNVTSSLKKYRERSDLSYSSAAMIMTAPNTQKGPSVTTGSANMPWPGGHGAVWHGGIDIVFSSHHGLPSSDLAVKTVNKCEPDVHEEEEEAETSTPRKKRKKEGDLEETDISPGGKSVTEVKYSTSGALEQTLAQTIVFSLLQKQKHPNLQNFLIPNILISPEEIQIFMYDAEYDVLLCSNIIELFDPSELCLNPETLIILWMVLHYRMFCTGLPPLLHKYRSHFKDLTEATWDIYSKSLKSGVSGFPVIEKPDFHTYLTFAKEIC